MVGRRVSLASGPIASVPLALGVHDVALTVTDRKGAADSDVTAVTVQDTYPPQGGITAPSQVACFGPAALPITITDDFADLCDPVVVRTYSPAPGPTYSDHGDHHVVLTVADRSVNAASASADFAIDTVPPLVELLSPLPGAEVFPGGLPFDVIFQDADDDGATGAVVREVVRLQDCSIYDGATYGDRDGLLSDESLQLTPAELCRIAAECGFTRLDNPELRVEATDCGGNVGSARRTLLGSLRLVGGICGSAAPRLVPSTGRLGGGPRGAGKTGSLSRR